VSFRRFGLDPAFADRGTEQIETAPRSMWQFAGVIDAVIRNHCCRRE
jgi:hypothetical protein